MSFLHHGVLRAFLLGTALLFLPRADAKLLPREKRLQRVKRLNGRVLVQHIPPVEAKRNFCVPASVEMVLRYYGGRINQVELGKHLNSSRRSGTGIGGLEKKFRVKPLEAFDCRLLYAMTKVELEHMLAVYLKSPKVGSGARKKVQKNKNDTDTFDLLDPKEIFRIVPDARPELMKKLPEILRKHIDSGYPLLWCVAMNLDPNDRDDGFHMRVICGYRESEGEITEVVYLDPWTGKRKLKYVKLTQAVAMTTHLYLVTPVE